MTNPTLKRIVAMDALRQIPMVLKDLSIGGKVLLIADDRTFKTAGVKVREILLAGGFQLVESILERKEQLVPDERALGEILVKMESDIQLLLAVGSGSITDLTRYLSYQLNKPFVAVPTAPSMDGYASSVAPLTIRGLKQTLTAVAPSAIIADTGVLANAPREMILAGFGDLLGKYTSLADWKLSNIITEEKYSEEIAAQVRAAVDQTVANMNPQVVNLDLIKNLTEALIVSGEAMQQWGNSRPASGAEHHLAHFWEMQAALSSRPDHLHGTKVGVALILVAEVYHRLFQQDLKAIQRLISQRKPESETEYTDRVNKAYGPLAGDILSDLKGLYWDSGKRAVRQERITQNWEVMKKWVQLNIPTPGQLKEFMLRVGAPIDPGEIGINQIMLKSALENAKEIRTRYTVFRLADDIGWSMVF